MSYEDIRQATLSGARDAIAKGATAQQIKARAAKMRADATLLMGAWPAFILKIADEVEALVASHDKPIGADPETHQLTQYNNTKQQ